MVGEVGFKSKEEKISRNRRFFSVIWAPILVRKGWDREVIKSIGFGKQVLQTMGKNTKRVCRGGGGGLENRNVYG